MTKPASCSGCPLEQRGSGYAPPSGSPNAKILLIGEALGYEEALAGKPFVGPSGQLLERILAKVGKRREDFLIDNTLRCRPPGNDLDGAWYEYQACQHCAPHLYGDPWGTGEQGILNDGQVVVAIGGTATRRLLGLGRSKHVQANWHGCPTEVEGFWDSSGWQPSGGPKITVVPTFHPSYLLKGNQKLTGTVAWDTHQALSYAQGRWKQDTPSLLLDPSPADFESWASHLGPETWLAVDIETPESETGADESELEDKSYEILRINFSYSPDEGVTVPWSGPYLPTIRRLLREAAVLCFWNARYDCPRLLAAGMEFGGNVLDFMWAWHILQSSLPRGLGFVAPFYSTAGAWKHASSTQPQYYAAMDAVQTLRCAFGIAKDLQNQGQWDIFLRHVVDLDQTVLGPAEEVGLLVNTDRLAAFRGSLEAAQTRLIAECQVGIPDDLRPLSPPHGWKKEPTDKPLAFPLERSLLVNRCMTCGESDVTPKHHCRVNGKLKNGHKKAENLLIALQPKIEPVEMVVKRWFTREDFNPLSSKQLISYMGWKGHKPGRNKQSGGDSADEQTLQRLSKKDPFYDKVLKLRRIQKDLTNYVSGSERQIGKDSRLHPEFTHVPSTGRLSCRNPNLQNVTKSTFIDEAGDIVDAGELVGFRKCVVAAPGCVLVEADYKAIEAVLTGYFAGDANLIKAATLGIHGAVVRTLHNLPVDWTQSEAALTAQFEEAKKKWPDDYDRAKRTVYGTFYGMSPWGLAKTYPQLFSKRQAEQFQGMLWTLFPMLQRWQNTMRDLAQKQGFLGGSDHPYHYKHWFWNVYNWDSKTDTWSLGADSKRVVAFYPQSTAAGIIKEAALNLMEDAHFASLTFGKTPIRALIHDSILLEVPEEEVPFATSHLRRVMTAPIPALHPPLSIGISIKTGKDWLDMEEL